MARKAVLEGGKRDEIIEKATLLFFSYGFEATSVRMILEQVGGEVGMFYHYFKSKEDLFQAVVERFFTAYQENFISMTIGCNTKEQFFDKFFTYYEQSMDKYNRISPNLHWSIQYAMTARTVIALKPAMEQMISKWNVSRQEPIDIVADQFLYALSATLHSDSFQKMDRKEKEESLRECARLLL